MKLRAAVSPRIARGPVVLSDPHVTASGVFTSDQQKTVVKLDKGSLKELWRRRSQLLVFGGLTDLVYVGSGADYEAWDDAGALLWKREFPRDIYQCQDRLYLRDDAGIQILDIRTAAVLGRFDCPDGFPALLEPDALLLQDPLRIDPLRLVDLGARRITWQKDIVSEMKIRYGIDEAQRIFYCIRDTQDRVVLVRSGHFFGMSLATGELLWALPMRLPYNVPQVRDGRAYVWTANGTPAERTTEIDLQSGRVGRSSRGGSAADHRFVIVDTAKGTILLDRPLAGYGSMFRMPHEPRRGTLCRNHIVFTTDAGLIAVFRLSDGELIWSDSHPDALRYPVFAENRLYVPSDNGTVVMFEPEDGEL